MNTEMRMKVYHIIHHDGYNVVKNNDMNKVDIAKGKLISLLRKSPDLKAAVTEFDRAMYYYWNTFNQFLSIVKAQYQFYQEKRYWA